MKIAVTGSIAIDQLMAFPGRFTDQLVEGALDKVSLSFLVEEMHVRRGGTAANIAYGLGRLGLTPILVGAVGADFDDHRSWLDRHGVDTKSVHVSRTQHTSRFLCTTDRTQNQIASFYAGAMSEAREIELRPVADRVGGLDLVLVAPNDPMAMVRHTEECRARGYRFAADPSQQLATMSGEEVRGLVEGAEYLFTNEYETSLLLKGTGWSADDVLARVGCWVRTHGGDGVWIDSGAESLRVPAVPAKEVDPTGIGDGFRAGFLWGLHARLSPERAAQAGCTLATIVLESLGGQEYTVDRGAFADRVAKTYGGEAAGEIESRLRARY